MKQGMKVSVTYLDGNIEELTVEQTDVVVFVGRMASKHIKTIPWTAIKWIEIDLNDQPRIAQAVAVPPEQPKATPKLALVPK